MSGEPAETRTVSLGAGCNMPLVGLGTYSRQASPGQYRRAVEHAIAVGYRHIDTAAVYGNEREVGEGIASKIRDGTVAREDLFVTSKLWNDRHADVVPALQESLGRLGLDYLDLYLVHWPVSVRADGADARVDHASTWRQMERAQELGLARRVGVSNFSAEQLARLLRHATVPPAVNQFEINPTLTQHALVERCLSAGVRPVAYTPLGLLSAARPEFAHLDRVRTDAALGALAARLGRTRAQLALRYLVQRGIPVIPKSFTPGRIEENLDIFDFSLDAEGMALLDGFNMDHRCVPGDALRHLTEYPF